MSHKHPDWHAMAITLQTSHIDTLWMSHHYDPRELWVTFLRLLTTKTTSMTGSICSVCLVRVLLCDIKLSTPHPTSCSVRFGEGETSAPALYINHHCATIHTSHWQRFSLFTFHCCSYFSLVEILFYEWQAMPAGHRRGSDVTQRFRYTSNSISWRTYRWMALNPPNSECTSTVSVSHLSGLARIAMAARQTSSDFTGIPQSQFVRDRRMIMILSLNKRSQGRYSTASAATASAATASAAYIGSISMRSCKDSSNKLPLSDSILCVTVGRRNSQIITFKAVDSAVPRTLTFDVFYQLRRWLRNPLKNKGLTLTLRDCYGLDQDLSQFIDVTGSCSPLPTGNSGEF